MSPGVELFENQGHHWQDLCKTLIILLHTIYTSFGSCGFREEYFVNVPYCKSMADNDVPGTWPV